MRALKAGATYFLVVFAAGFVLGILRAVAVAPRLGERGAELLELPIMVAVSYLAARWTDGRFRLGGAGERLATGAVALALLVAAEVGVVFGVRGETLSEYVAGRDPVAGVAYLASLVAFAPMPLVVRR